MPTVLNRILIAPSGFKESLDANQVAAAIVAGVARVLPEAETVAAPIADGGEGTAQTLAEATGGRLVPCRVMGPVGQQVDSSFALLGGAAAGVAVVEMAAAAGLRLVPRDQRNPGTTTTYGVGQLIAAAIDAGAEQILVGCGDSGTSDGGAGALQALGAQVLDGSGQPIERGGENLIRAERVDLSGLHPALAEGRVPVTLALNWHNVLCGERGVARVFGPQKGATPEQVEQLSAGFDRWAALLQRDCLPSARGIDFATGPGTGASGGLGAGLAAVGATLMQRFEALLDSGLAGVDLDALMTGVDLVITAEGGIDFQTPRGKVPAEVARRARQRQIPVLAVAGTIGTGADDVYPIGIDAITSTVCRPMALAEAVADAEELLADAVERQLRAVLLGIRMAGG